MGFIAYYRTSQQISPDDWETINRTLEIDENTTIRQIRDWVYKLENVTEGRKEHFKINVQLSQTYPKP